MPYCRIHKIHWRDDDLRDEQFDCPYCGQWNRDEEEQTAKEFEEDDDGED